jgi:hypothetical protein
MKIFRQYYVLIVFSFFIPAVLFGFDLPGYATFHGKVIDAETLKPIEGAVVYAIWSKCRPGIGSGSCETDMVKEVLTDANGEWQITGPKGINDVGIIRSILGILVPWNKPPRIRYYKPGFFPFQERYVSGDFSAYAYVDKSKNIEGIVLIRWGDTEAEVKQNLEQSQKDGCVTLVPAKDPERKLRELDFNFKCPAYIQRVQGINDKTLYKVIGLKRAVTSEEKREARSLASNGFYPNVYQPLLKKAIEERE